MSLRASKFTGMGIVIVQVVDILIHAATDQLEFLRVTSNLVILIWLAILFFNKRMIKPSASFGSISLYLFLNLLFLAQAGFTNPAQGDAPRTMLFILVILTILLSTLLTLTHQRSGHIS